MDNRWRDSQLDCPLFEFSPEAALIEPEKSAEMKGKLLICFFAETISELLSSGEIEPYLVLPGENELTVYRKKESEVFLVKGIIGSPAIGGFLEEMIGKGIKEVLFIGGAGSLVKSELGKIFLVTSAIRDEGFSYHYLPASRYVDADIAMRGKLQDFLLEEGVIFDSGRVWTTDAFYRETPSKIKRRIAEGAKLVEMEQAGLIALCQFRHIPYGALLYSGDDLSGLTREERGWRRSEARMKLTALGLKFLLNSH